ncbi:MAG TPA: alpha-amylase family glycosyl hydrolase [Clostridia bacterium]|nr:alpha-amylase family glycosyl hydrolase [Clostridia bacterium]
MKTITKKILSILVSILMMLTFASCSTDALRGEKAIKIDELPDIDVPGVYYEIFVGGFSDSDEDGTGDIKGIINRIDYLNDGDPLSGKSLGIEGIWLMPIMQAGSYHKYDVVDYYSIDLNYGTMEDFEQLISVCDAKGIDIIIDLVLNHTSEYNRWFLDLKNAIKEGDKDNKYMDWYSITTDSSKGWHKLAEDPDGVQYYYEGNFSPSMPELNMDNPEVLDEIDNIVKFWLEKGVKGFRLDAVKYVYLSNDIKNIEFWKWFADTCRKYDEDVFLVGENWSNTTSVYEYYEALDCFDFDMAGSGGDVALTVNGIFNLNDYVRNICRYKENVEISNPDAILKPFISNHDMDRSAGYLSVKENRMHMAANLYMLSSGNPFMYYGEEIGMYGSRATSSTDANRRLAMLWGDKDTVQDPPGTTFPAERQINGTVKQQIKQHDSLYTYYKKLIALRKANPEIAVGDYIPLKFEGYNLFGGFLVQYENVTKGVFHNLSNEPITIDLSTYTDIKFDSISGYIGQGKARLNGNILTLDGLTSVILK